MTKRKKPAGIIYFSPQNWRELIYKKVRDNRISTLNTVELIGRHSNATLFTVIYWVGNQRECYIFGRNIKWLRRYTR